MEHLQIYSLSNHTANMSLAFFKYSSFALPLEIKDLKYLSIQLEVLLLRYFPSKLPEKYIVNSIY